MMSSRLPEFNGVATRVSADDFHRFRGQYVTIVCRPLRLGDTGAVVLEDLTSGKEIEVSDLSPNSELAQVNEFVCFVNPATAALTYHSHGTLNDDFDADVYKKLVEVVRKFPGLF